MQESSFLLILETQDYRLSINLYRLSVNLSCFRIGWYQLSAEFTESSKGESVEKSAKYQGHSLNHYWQHLSWNFSLQKETFRRYI